MTTPPCFRLLLYTIHTIYILYILYILYTFFDTVLPFFFNLTIPSQIPEAKAICPDAPPHHLPQNYCYIILANGQVGTWAPRDVCGKTISKGSIRAPRDASLLKMPHNISRRCRLLLGMLQPLKLPKLKPSVTQEASIMHWHDTTSGMKKAWEGISLVSAKLTQERSKIGLVEGGKKKANRRTWA